MKKKSILWGLRTGQTIKEQVNLGANRFIIKIYPNGEMEINSTYEAELKQQPQKTGDEIC